MKKILVSNRGEGYIDTAVIVIVAMLVIAMAVKVYPVFIAKNELNTFAVELARVAEIEGRIGSVTKAKENELKASMGISPNIQWSRTGKIQLNEEFSVVVSHTVDIGFFEFGSFPITLKSKATGRSEVYYK
ncbi:DUF4320 family protein [Tepidibacter hydrothermalis]|uniref:DUF4320 family protein n=1 Tax=Tepidibacter hydrothermalis TaxID=3036126 RepID=A0ABY8EH01_9FIRM|nr:DUF4320 family protein [Tepidibacter hydrothermalis]WFD10864.1 DUF4320 family protein [Tepidibacter hydrothermalis]